jgi:CRP/FNR family transcriptional regulator, cyclic AMP receptor protein
VLGLGATANYPPRRRILRQGEDSRYVLLVLSGCVKVVVHSEFGRDVVVELRGGGDFVGEMAMLEGGVRPANVVTCTATRARLIRGTEFAELLARNVDVGLAVAKTISHQLRSAYQRRVELIACPAGRRVVAFLADIERRHGTSVPGGTGRDIPLNQQEIASLAGVALSTVEKTLRTMQADGLVSRHYRRIVVTDPARLRRLGDPSPQNPY